jgi:AmmeMemoRadiSam system protein B
MVFGRRLTGPAGGAVRLPAVAGQFYPDDPDVLAADVDAMLDAVDVPADDELARAYLVPHAGYRYSGPTAAHVYAGLRAHAASVSRVIIVGPAHRVPLKGCAVSGADRWLTPLGAVAVDRHAADVPAPVNDEPHAPEHSIEVQLPFLQRALGDAVVLPIAVGAAPAGDVADTIAAAVALAPAGTVVLCSTDLSHYLPDEQARRQDQRTLAAVGELAPDRIGVRDACGVYALRGLLAWARREGLVAHLLSYATSADTGADPGRVVGYPAASLSSSI